MPIVRKPPSTPTTIEGAAGAANPGSSISILRSEPVGPIALPGSDFTILAAPKRQANILLYADAGNGKSTFGLRFAPHPVAMINYDKRAHYAVSEAQKLGRRILYAQIDIPANVTKLGDDAAKKIGQAAVDKTVRNFELAVRESQKGNVRTIILDTGTEYSEVLSLAIKGKPSGKSNDYGKSKDWINREWWRLWNLAREGNAHFIVLARAREIWENSEPTGRFTFRGPEVLNDGADWAGWIRVKKARGVGGVKKIGGGPGAGGGVKEFELEITKAGANIAELGAVYSSAEWEEYGGPFVYACSLQFPGSVTEDWE